MCKIIGITARKGAGRKTAAWLLAQTMEEKWKGTPYEKYKALFECWVKLVIIDPAEAGSTDHVMLDSFGEHITDQVKQFCPKLIEYDLHDDDVLNGYLINPTNFEIIKAGLRHAYTAKEMAEHQFNEVEPGVWMTLGEFILYFARDVMKKAFGPNVWLNVAIATANSMGTTDTRIYWDVKTQAELDYISKCGGTIIELRNADREHDTNASYRDIKYLDPDIILDTTLGLEGCAELFWNAVNNLN